MRRKLMTINKIIYLKNSKKFDIIYIEKRKSLIIQKDNKNSKKGR